MAVVVGNRRIVEGEVADIAVAAGEEGNKACHRVLEEGVLADASD